MGNVEEPWLQPYGKTAITDDILGCFRLILGRWPNPAESIPRPLMEGPACEQPRAC